MPSSGNWRRWPAAAAEESRTWRRRAFPTRRASHRRSTGSPTSCVVCSAQRERAPMSSGTLASWLASRTPPPPGQLASRIEQLVAEAALGSDTPVAPVERLLAAAEGTMTGLLRDGCITRVSALDLLAVDALVTYAFEAAADRPDELEA